MAEHDDYEILVTLDDNDTTMQMIDLDIFPHVTKIGGVSTSKINAVNRDTPKTGWDIGVVTSDDMTFIMKGFDKQILKDVGENKKCAVHYTDGFEHGNIMSLPVVTKEYWDMFGYFYHPSYQSLFADEEAYIVAEKLGMLVSSDAKIVRHDHPTWIGGVVDAQLRKTESLYHIDKITFNKRKAKNFYLGGRAA